MKLEGLEYSVKAYVRFTIEEVDYLVERAKNHYDHTCQMYGCAIGEMGAVQNGVLARLKLFPRSNTSAKTAFTFRELGTMLKIIELPFGNKVLREQLTRELSSICAIIQARHLQLQKE